MTNPGKKRKSDEAEIEEAASALQNLSLAEAEVAPQEVKRRRKTRSRRTKTQSQIQRRKDSNGGHAKNHPKDLQLLSKLEASIAEMLTSIRESMSNGTKSLDTISSQPPTTKNHEQSSCKRRPRGRPYSDEESKKRSRKPACTTDSTIEELALSFSRLSLSS